MHLFRFELLHVVDSLLLSLRRGRRNGRDRGFFLVTPQVIVFHEASTLNSLCRKVGNVTAEEQHVSGLDLPSESHEYKRVEAQSCKKVRLYSNRTRPDYCYHSKPNTCGHLATNNFGILSCDIGNSGQRNSPIRYWTPEVGAVHRWNDHQMINIHGQIDKWELSDQIYLIKYSLNSLLFRLSNNRLPRDFDMVATLCGRVSDLG